MVATERGELFLCEDGAFKCYIPDSPVDDKSDLKVEAIIPFSQGFIVAGNDNLYGKFYVYQQCSDPNIQYRLISKDPYWFKAENQSLNSSSMNNFMVSSMCLSIAEDYVFYTTKSN